MYISYFILLAVCPIMSLHGSDNFKRSGQDYPRNQEGLSFHNSRDNTNQQLPNQGQTVQNQEFGYHHMGIPMYGLPGGYPNQNHNGNNPDNKRYTNQYVGIQPEGGHARGAADTDNNEKYFERRHRHRRPHNPDERDSGEYRKY